jgi:hypothetical protein
LAGQRCGFGWRGFSVGEAITGKRRGYRPRGSSYAQKKIRATQIRASLIVRVKLNFGFFGQSFGIQHHNLVAVKLDDAGGG